ncbi:MAG: hypothetical protein M1821_003163 [Bathelium mastoideum]|nr:MAG: hypothetical protein M1821_003163 [Bathelium mastoideum]
MWPILSGAKQQSLSGSDDDLKKKGLKRFHPVQTSAEKYLPESTEEGGVNAYLMGVAESGQGGQAKAYAAFYTKKANDIEVCDTFEFKYEGKMDEMKHCKALLSNDKDICEKGDGSGESDPANRIFQKVSEKGRPGKHEPAMTWSHAGRGEQYCDEMKKCQQSSSGVASKELAGTEAPLRQSLNQQRPRNFSWSYSDHHTHLSYFLRRIRY